MNSNYYRVVYEDIVIAEKMSLETALILVNALFEKFYCELTLHYTIERMYEEEKIANNQYDLLKKSKGE